MNQFQNSVGDWVLRDPTTKIAYAHGMTASSTAMAQTMNATETRGGFGNQLLYTFFHDKKVEFTLETPVWSPYMLALQNGNSITSGTYTVVASDCVTLSSGSGVLTNLPTGGIVTFIFDDNNASSVITPSGSTIYIANGANRKGYAMYDYSATADQIVGTAGVQPAVAELIITAKVYDASHTSVVQYFQIDVPQWKLDGNFSIAMAPNDASKQTLKGMALVNTATDCSSGDYYYKATYINVSGTSAAYNSIATNPSPWTVSVAAGLPKTQQLSCLGIRTYPNVDQMITTGLTFTKTSGSAALTVSAGGLMTAGSATTAGMIGTIGITYWDATSGSLNDSVVINVTA